MGNSAKRVFRFERFYLDLGRGSLRTGDTEIPLRPKSFDVLCYLAANAGRLVSKQELDEAVWPNVAVTDASLAQCIRELREKLGDAPRTLIKTVHRRGYMLDTVVTEATTETPWVAAQASVAVGGGHQRIEPESRIGSAPGADEGVVESSPRSAGDNAASDKAAAELPRESGLDPASGDRARRRLIPLRRWAPALLMATAAVALIVYSAPTSWFPKLALMQGGSTKNIQPRTMFRDCGECPEMVVLPASESGEWPTENGKRAGPPKMLAVGRFEITVEQFAAFVDQSKYDAGNRCNTVTFTGKDVSLRTVVEASFRQQPDKQITGRHPAGCVNWHDAKAYAAWLAAKTGKPYRLLNGAEWEYAARAGTTGIYSFEGGVTRLCEYARFADLNSQFPWASTCHSGNPERGALPVGSLKPNPWGLFDMHGNLWELVDDCISNDPAILAAPDANSPSTGECKVGVARGGGWAASSRRVDVGFRIDVPTDARSQPIGFRVGLTLDP
jgi:formylglycine-generating enzyme required for sulfatase activity/DNA-binding winged helix-turn-helix (wHTH) protein